MAINYQTFLDHHHFRRDPFETIRAEHEREYQPALFQPSALVPSLLGDPATPRAAVLVGPEGAGKTAHRLALERNVLHHPTPGLALTIDDVQVLHQLEAQPLERYVTLTAELLMRRLSDLLTEHAADRLERMQREAPQHYALLYTAWQRYTPDALYGRPEPSAQAAVLHARFAPHLGPRHLFRTLSAIVQSCGFRCPYILVDCLEDGTPSADLDLVVQLLTPLLIDRGLLDDCGIAWRFFFPDRLFAAFDNEVVARIRRFQVQTLDWTTDELCAMLSRRLLDCSRSSDMKSVHNSYIELMSQFFNIDDDRVDRALAELVATPRALLKLARKLLEAHCATVDDPKQSIDPGLLAAFIKEHGGTAPELFAVPPSAAATEPTVTPSASGVPLLRLHDDGRVTIGGKEIIPPLPIKRYKALKLLWENRGRVVSYEQFEQAFYEPETEFNKPKSAREKLIGWLRLSLEPNNPAGKRSRNYIDLSGDGYVLRNYEAAHEKHV